ncbi:MAG TPA: phospholipase domain-containing protein, partial [Albitalea sp.]|nr:phospholipase domain-containing protein [Albitalea sp.]
HRAVCGDMTSCFDFEHPNDAAFPVMPDTSGYATIEAQQKTLPAPMPPATSELPRQERGVRLSRALPYELLVGAKVSPAQGIVLTFRNTGRAGAVFHVYDKLHLDRIPRRYTVEAGKSLNDSWAAMHDGGAYDLWIYGPNGFVRQFKGQVDIAHGEAEVTAGYETARGLLLRFSNPGDHLRVLQVMPNAYLREGPMRVHLRPRSHSERLWTLERSGHWYDFSITDDSAPQFLRRVAGRMETGRHGISDPAFGIA